MTNSQATYALIGLLVLAGLLVGVFFGVRRWRRAEPRTQVIVLFAIGLGVPLALLPWIVLPHGSYHPLLMIGSDDGVPFGVVATPGLALAILGVALLFLRKK